MATQYGGGGGGVVVPPVGGSRDPYTGYADQARRAREAREAQAAEFRRQQEAKDAAARRAQERQVRPVSPPAPAPGGTRFNFQDLLNRQAAERAARKAAEQQALLTRGTERERLELQAKLQAEAEARRLEALKGLFGGGGGGLFPPGVPGGGGPGGGVPPTIGGPAAGGPAAGGPTTAVGNPQEQAVRDIAFARAKDVTGNLAASQLRGLEGAMASRGVSGSPIELMGQAQVLGGARGGLDKLASEQMLQDLNRAAQVADLQYTGGITQRGQDIGYLSAQRNALMNLFGQLF